MYIRFLWQEHDMRHFNRSAALALVVCFGGLAAFSSSAVAESSSKSTNDAATKSDGFHRTTVFGRFRILKNGTEVHFGDGFFSNVAALRFYRPADQEEFTGRVEKDGEFSLKLAPGEYYLMSIAFKHHGETIEPETDYVFNVPADYDGSYVGTITLETTFSSGYTGMKGTFDRFVVSNDCKADCSGRMSDLGLTGKAVNVALPEWKEHVAAND